MYHRAEAAAETAPMRSSSGRDTHTCTGPPGQERERRLRTETAHLENTGNSDSAYNRSAASPQDAASARLRRQRLVAVIVGLGERCVYELFAELDRDHGLGGDLDDRLERYARLDPTILHAVGGDRFPTSPIRIIGDEP